MPCRERHSRPRSASPVPGGPCCACVAARELGHVSREPERPPLPRRRAPAGALRREAQAQSESKHFPPSFPPRRRFPTQTLVRMRTIPLPLPPQSLRPLARARRARAPSPRKRPEAAAASPLPQPAPPSTRSVRPPAPCACVDRARRPPASFPEEPPAPQPVVPAPPAPSRLPASLAPFPPRQTLPLPPRRSRGAGQLRAERRGPVGAGSPRRRSAP